MNAGENKETGKLANTCKVNRPTATKNTLDTKLCRTRVDLTHGATSAANSNGVDDTQRIPALI